MGFAVCSQKKVLTGFVVREVRCSVGSVSAWPGIDRGWDETVLCCRHGKRRVHAPERHAAREWKMAKGFDFRLVTVY